MTTRKPEKGRAAGRFARCAKRNVIKLNAFSLTFTAGAIALIHRGGVLGVVPKTYLPTYREFYEARHFGSGKVVVGLEISIGTMHAPFGTDLLFEADDVPGLVIGIEVCEDMWIPVTPRSELALEGTTVLTFPEVPLQ